MKHASLYGDLHRASKETQGQNVSVVIINEQPGTRLTAQVEAYEAIKSAAETIMMVPHFFSSGSPPTPAPAKTNNQIDCQTPPMIRGHRREKRPITQIPKNCRDKEMSASESAGQADLRSLTVQKN